MAEAQDRRQALGGRAWARAGVHCDEWEQPSDQPDGGTDWEGNPGARLDHAEGEAKSKRGPPNTKQHPGAG